MKKTIFLIPMLMLSTLPMLAGCTKNCTVTIINNNPDMGEVSGSGTYKSGSTIYLSAKPFESYSFVKWDGDKKGTREQFSIYVDQDMTIYANFEHYKYNVTFDTENFPILGKVVGETAVGWGEQTDVSIKPYSGYKVDTWQEVGGEVLSRDNNLKVEMPKHDLNLRLKFESNTYTFGRYQQTKVTDSDLINSLNSFISFDDSYGEYNDQTYYRKSINNFYIVEPISWDVVEETDDYMMLISSSALYSYESKCIEYGTSDLRSYLNDKFYLTSFTTSEKEKFYPMTHIIENNATINDPVFIPFSSRFVYDDGSSESLRYKFILGSDFANSFGIRIWDDSNGKHSPFVYYDIYGSNGYINGADRNGFCAGGNAPFGVRPIICLDKSLLED